jgi:transposase
VEETRVYRKRPAQQVNCFIPGSLGDYVPEDHILRQVEAILDLSWLDEEVKHLYAEEVGRPCIPPEQALRLMLAGYFDGITQDRKLVRHAQVNLAYRWFAGYELDEVLPDHSSFTRLRQRWGEERFRRILLRTVRQCVEAGLVGGETVHVDASLIRADVSWESLVEEHLTRVQEANPQPEEEAPKSAKSKKVSTTDPEASLTTSNQGQRLEPSYKQHTVVDDQEGVIVDLAVTTGEDNEGQELLAQLARVEEQTGYKPEVVTADAAYASSANYAELEKAGVLAVIPPQREGKPRTPRNTPRKGPLGHPLVQIRPRGK